MYDSQRQKFLDYLRQVPTPSASEAFHHDSTFNKAVFCLGEKQGTLVNNECSSWYTKLGDFVMSVWGRRKEILYDVRSVGEASQTSPTPECKVKGTECYGA